MKKILPTFLLLILCVGVLTMGIYAVAPTRNTVDGTINIVAFNGAPVSLEIIKDGETIQEVTNCKAAQPISFGEIDLPTTLGSWQDCPEVRFSIKIKNEGNSAIGAFFTDRSTILGDGELADGTDDIILSKTFKQDSTTIAQMYLSSYTPISVGDTEEMAISFVLRALPTEAQSYNLGLNLYIEEYVASTDKTKVLYKVAEGTTSVDAASEELSGKIVALPKSVTSIYTYGGCPKMINVPNNNSIQVDFSQAGFNGIFIPENSTLNHYTAGNDVGATNTAFVSYDNPSFCNDNQYAIYNKDKTILQYLAPIDTYIAPSTVTSLFGGVCSFASNCDIYDFSKCDKMEEFNLYQIGAYDLSSYEIYFNSNIKTISSDVWYNYDNGTITLNFAGTNAPTIGELFSAKYLIKVPTGSLSAYQTAFNVNNASAVTAGKITFQEV